MIYKLNTFSIAPHLVVLIFQCDVSTVFFAFIVSICSRCMSCAFSHTYSWCVDGWEDFFLCCNHHSYKNMICICFVSLSSFHTPHSMYSHIKLVIRNSRWEACDHLFHLLCFQQIGILSSYFLIVLNRFSVWCKADKLLAVTNILPSHHILCHGVDIFTVFGVSFLLLWFYFNFF